MWWYFAIYEEAERFCDAMSGDTQRPYAVLEFFDDKAERFAVTPLAEAEHATEVAESGFLEIQRRSIPTSWGVNA